MATRTKLCRVLSSVSCRKPVFGSGSCSNGGKTIPGSGLGTFLYSSSALAQNECEVVGSRHMGLEILGVKDYVDYRRSLYGEISHKALLVDAVGTLVVPSQPMAQVSFSFSSFFLCIYVCTYMHITYLVVSLSIYIYIYIINCGFLGDVSLCGSMFSGFYFKVYIDS